VSGAAVAAARAANLIVASAVAYAYSYIPLLGPDRTRTDFFAARVSEKPRWVRAVRAVRAGPRGSGRVRVVEFSLYQPLDLQTLADLGFFRWGEVTLGTRESDASEH